jgi:hypothetical protein
MARVGLIVVLLFPTACATLTGRHQYVAVDSPIRGVEVRHAEAPEVVLGRTPVVLQLSRARTQELLLRRGQQSTSVELRCRHRLAESAGANLIPATMGLVLGPFVGATAYGFGTGVDLLTGAAWACPPKLLLEPDPAPDAPPPEPEPPTRYLVVPPHGRVTVSRALVREFVLRVHERDPSASVVDALTAEREFQRFGLGPSDAFHLTRFPRDALNELAFRTGATRLVELSYEPDGVRPTVQSRLTDVFTLEQAEFEPFEADLSEELADPERWSELLVRSLAIVPSGIGAGLVLREPLYEGANGARVVERDRERLGPPPAVGVSVNFVPTRAVMPRWGFQLRLAAQATAGLEQRSLTIERNGTEREVFARIAFAGATFGPRLGYFTPLGELALYLGGGALASASWERGSERRLGTDPVGVASVNHTAFLSQRIYLRLGIALLHGATPLVERDDYQLRRLVAPTVSVGYHSPEARGWLRDLF